MVHLASDTKNGEKKMDILTEATSKFLEAAIDMGFRFPLYMAALAVNGSVIVAKYTPTNGKNSNAGVDARFIAEHIEGRGMALPINVMLTDSTGQAARMLIEGPDTEPVFFWPVEG